MPYRFSYINFYRTEDIMNDEYYEQLQKTVDYLENEGFAEEAGVSFKLFRNAEEAIAAIRNNEIPGVEWTEECEQKWQMQNRLEEIVRIKEEDDDWEVSKQGFNLNQELQEGWDESF